MKYGCDAALPGAIPFVSKDVSLALDRRMEARLDGALALLAMKLTRVLGDVSSFAIRGVDMAFCLRNKSSLEEKLKLGMEGTESLKFESCQLSLIAFSRLFTCSDTFSNRESSPREEAIDRER